MLKNSNRQLAESNVMLAEKNIDFRNRNKDLSDEVNLKIADNRRYNEENAKIAGQNEELVRENGRLSREQELLRKINSDLYAGATELEEKNRTLASKNRDLANENQRLVADSNTKRAAAMSVTALYSTLEALRTRPIAVHTGEDLARVTIPAQSTRTQVWELLKQLTRDASDSAKAKGADPGERGTTLAVQIVDKRTLADTPFGVRGLHLGRGADQPDYCGYLQFGDSGLCAGDGCRQQVKGEFGDNRSAANGGPSGLSPRADGRE